MKAVISVHGRFHAFDLAAQLHKRGLLARLITTYPAAMVHKFLPKDIPLKTAARLEMIRRFHFKTGLGDASDLRIASAFGPFAAKNLPKEADLFIGWSGASLEAARTAKKMGMKVVIERGSSHIAHQTNVLAHAYLRSHIRYTPTEVGLIERELEEYAIADAIAVPSRFAAETFVNQGIPEEKLIVNPYGVDLKRFGGQARIQSVKPRIVFVGLLGPRKGVPGLIEAFKPLADRAELHLIGPKEPGMDGLLSRVPSGVHVRGPLPMEKLAAEYARGSVFCLPSVEEGLALVVLQAMAAGLPLVVTKETGAAEVMEEGKEGLFVPSGDLNALTAALESLIADPAKAQSMGDAARKKVATGFTWDDYGDRAVSAYEKMLK